MNTLKAWETPDTPIMYVHYFEHCLAQKRDFIHLKIQC